MRRFWTILLFALVLPLAIAVAHVTATGLAVLEIADAEISYRLTVVPAELPGSAGAMLTRAVTGSRPDVERLFEAMRESVRVRVDAEPCRPGRFTLQDVGAGIKLRMDLTLHCPRPPGRLEIEEDWRALFGEHYQTVVTIKGPRGGGEHVLGQGLPALAIDLGMPAPSGLAGFVRLGVMHILTGYDHCLFLLALIAGAGGIWQVIGIASMFTLAHSITLSVAALGLLHAPASLVEPLIAGSIVWVAAENLAGVDGLWRRLGVTFVFGLVHGVGFADALEPLALSGWSLVQALAGFNMGVEFGQAAVIVIAVPALIWLCRLLRSAVVYRAASIASGTAGAYWLAERLGLT